MPTAIKFENISKQYRLGLVSTRTLSHDLNRWWQMNILRREDPYLRIGEVNDRAHKGSSEYVWALKDINFEVEQGDVVGIIGKNGAGKSTLLKILSKVTAPTTGNIKAKGRIASLLEVGTGFHPEMTGRENIYMNGAIMGMRKSEIDRKFDEIVDFAGVERYIDTPVKRYSSGMTVRLGFAVAAFLEPEILVVDEVLAVGDAEFQKKAIGKMQDVSRGEGRTVLFVSHNMAAITDLCTRGILLNNGRILIENNIKSVVKQYLSSTNTISPQRIWNGSECPGNHYIKIRKVYFIDSNNNQIDFAFINQKFGFCIEYEVTEDVPFFTHGINVFNNIETHLFTSHDGNSYEGIKTIKRGKYKIISWIPANLLQSDTLDFSFACMRYNPFEILFHEMQLARINIIEAMNALTRNEHHRGDLPGIIRPKLDWTQRVEIIK
ncbi:ABC transporter ATP-binding protein [Paludibacter sp.]|uniref:ABC transporter ATP-binding protein n=1 Tax=Paludibacter sp. TaxID=1898105 RepID=UPI001354B896|nr:ABC transporter ATP-binding protein [Paludibacter sp.]MTK52602.1 ABC transporter ATP-binding protein [Paludibacter sp.]